MTYSEGHLIRLVGGRLPLDFVNTADWSADGEVLHERIRSKADLVLWLDALRLTGVTAENKISGLRTFRSSLRQVLLGHGDVSVLRSVRFTSIPQDASLSSIASGQRLKSLLAIATIALLSDHRERDRIKLCPGSDCGWMFIDETKNARRTWCSMETCGNRAKAARHYARSKTTGGLRPH